MLELYSNSKVVINRHIDIANGYSVNLRMFEATGAGALLLTERSPNLNLLFEPEVEVLTYGSTQEAIQKIEWALGHPSKAAAIARAGHERTRSAHLSEHRIERIQSLLLELSEDSNNSTTSSEVEE
jgi:spore maturation protein CgeB